MGKTRLVHQVKEWSASAKQQLFAKKNSLAWVNSCKNCSKPNHCAVCGQESKRKVLSMECESEYEEYVAVVAVEEQLNAVASASNSYQVFVTLLVNGKEEKFQLDSGSTVNIMADKTVKTLYGDNGLMYNQSEVNPLGKKRFEVVNPKNKKKYSIEFLIVFGVWKSILGFKASEHLQFLTISNILAMDCNAVKGGAFTKEDCLLQYQVVFSGEET